MENVFLNIMKRIDEGMPGISMIDEYYGQVETERDSYPIPGDCIFIKPVEADWGNITPTTQKGRAKITVMLAKDCFEDTHHGSGTSEVIRTRLLQEKALYVLLQGFCPGEKMGRLRRETSRNYPTPCGKKVYEIVFAFDVHDNSAAILQEKAHTA